MHIIFLGPGQKKITVREQYPGLNWVVQHRNAGFRLVYHFKVQLMVKVGDPYPLWTGAAFKEQIGDDSDLHVDILQSDCDRTSLAPFGAVCVWCHLILERTRKVSLKGGKKDRHKVATASVEIEMPNPSVKSDFFIKRRYRLKFIPLRFRQKSPALRTQSPPHTRQGRPSRP